MSDITSEQEKLLRTLICHTKDGDPAGEYVNRIRHPRRRPEREIETTGEIYQVNQSYWNIEPILRGLVDEGLIEPRHFDPELEDFFDFGPLTSKGRCYFKDRKQRRDDERAKIWSDRRFQIALSVLTMIASAILGFVGGRL